MLLNPLILARALGCDTSTPDWDDVRAAAARDDTCAVALALPLDDIISAVRARARERYPNAPTHAPTVAVGLLADLCGAGYPWGSPPREDYAEAVARASPTYRDLVREGDPEGPYVGACVATERAADIDYVADGAPLYASAHDVLFCFLGGILGADADADDAPDGGHSERSPERSEAIQIAAVDLVIALVCDDDHSIAEIAAGASAYLLARHPSRWASARARRICSAIGVRFP